MYGIYRDVGKKFKISEKLVERKFDGITPLIETNKITASEFWIRLAKKLKVKDTNSLKKIWLKSLKKNGPLNKKVVKIIKELKAKGYKVVAISNTFQHHEKLHRKLGHYRFFDKVFLSNRLEVRKPEKEIYLYCIKKLDVKPNECIFIDDKIRNVVGAKKVGMKAILFKNAEQLRRDLKKYL